MKIAYIVPYVPNLIRTRPYNFILQLVALGHKVEVFTLGSNAQDFADSQVLRDKGAIVHYFNLPVWRSFLNSILAIPTGQPLQTVYSWHAGMARQIAERVSMNEFDVVHVEHLRGSRYGLFIKSKFPSQPVVWDSVDCISHLFEQASGQSRSFFGRFVTRFELKRTRLAEGKLMGSFDHVLVTSSVDRDALQALVPAGAKSAPISVLANGVDQDFFRPNSDVQREPETLIFSGKMSYHANVSMAMYLAQEIMPRIWQKRPGVRLMIVGKDPSAAVRKLAYKSSVVVTGTVDDIRHYLWRATAAVVPLVYGAGIQNKILEAMATGTPVITTSSAIASLETGSGREILIADTPDEFAEITLQLLDDEHNRHEIGVAGIRYVLRNHAWNDIAQKLVDIYGSLV
jgi:polysaccharide biosynthesis protein PslH